MPNPISDFSHLSPEERIQSVCEMMFCRGGPVWPPGVGEIPRPDQPPPRAATQGRPYKGSEPYGFPLVST